MPIYGPASISFIAERLKYKFVVKPGVDPAQIKLRYRGAESVAMNKQGELEVRTALGSFHDEKPRAYQETDGRIAKVPVDYELLRKTPAAPGEFGFHLGAYDPGKPLIIDPAILVYAGFIGGSRDDRGNAIAVDADGNAYITGETNSSELTFPEKVGPDKSYNGGVDAFVAKVDATGTALLYAGFIGGTGDDRGNAIAVDAAGNAYITGETNSSESTFPKTAGPDTTYNGGIDAFVAKVDATGTTLLYAGYIGGSGDDRGNGIAVDGAANAYVTGETSSTEATFPDGDGFGSIPGFNKTYDGGVDAFVVKVDAAGTTLAFAAYIGGSGDDRGKGIAIDATGDIYIAGETNSTAATFPDKTGPDQIENLGFDAFVAKVCSSVCIDLSVTQVDLPDPVRAGDNLTYTIIVRNSGPNDATGVQLTDTLASSLIVVSATPTSGSCALGAPIICDLGNLASGGSITVTVVATTTVTGTVVSTASAAADQTEIAPGNNIDAEKTVVILPNLMVPILKASAAAVPGGDLVINDTTKNNGAVTAQASTTKFYLSMDNKSDGGDVLLGSRAIPALASKQNSAGSTTVTIPPGTALGNYFLIAVADADNIVAETKDTNKKTRKLTITRPDLTISRLQSPSSAAAGSSIVIKETTSNRTAVSAGASTTNFFISADAILDGSDTLLAGRVVPALAPKANSAASTTVDIPVSTPPGKYYLIVVCDGGDTVVEVNEGNNTRSKTITITP
ncbi:MAG: CARDB domain-containing protein [Alphaproteobacteria bacterium]